MIDKNTALHLIKESFESLTRSGTITESVDVKSDTVILGSGSPLDSIAFVTFVTDFEDRLQTSMQKECYLVLSDINNFNINNPNLTVDHLAQYVVQMSARTSA